MKPLRFQTVSAAMTLAAAYSAGLVLTFVCIGLSVMLYKDLIHYLIHGRFEFDKGDGASFVSYLTCTSLLGVLGWFWFGGLGWSRKVAGLLLVFYVAVPAGLICTRTRLLRHRWPYLKSGSSQPEPA